MDNSLMSQIIILFFIIGVGYFSRVKGWINKDAKKSFSHMLVNIALPCLLISSFNFEYSEDTMNIAKMIFVFSCLIHIILIFFSKILFFKFEKDSKKVLRYVTIFSNAAFMGYPVVGGIYGKIGVFYTAIFNIPVNIFMFTAGIIIFTEKRDLKTLKSIIIHPAIIATILGFIMFKTGFELPGVLSKSFMTIGSMTTPLAMIFIGAELAESRVNEIFNDLSAYYASFTRLILAPIITFVLLKLLNTDPMVLKICVLIEAMPAGALAPVLAEAYGANASLASKCVFITTVLSILTIPLVAMFL